MYEEEFFKYAEKAGIKDQILAKREAIPQDVIDNILKGVDGVKAFCNLEASKAQEYHDKINGAPKRKNAFKQLPKELIRAKKFIQIFLKKDKLLLIRSMNLKDNVSLMSM